MQVSQVPNDVGILGNHANHTGALAGYSFCSLTHRSGSATRIESGERRGSYLRKVTISVTNQRQEKQDGKPGPATRAPFEALANCQTREKQVQRRRISSLVK